MQIFDENLLDCGSSPALSSKVPNLCIFYFTLHSAFLFLCRGIGAIVYRVPELENDEMLKISLRSVDSEDTTPISEVIFLVILLSCFFLPNKQGIIYSCLFKVLKCILWLNYRNLVVVGIEMPVPS